MPGDTAPNIDLALATAKALRGGAAMGDRSRTVNVGTQADPIWKIEIDGQNSFSPQPEQPHEDMGVGFGGQDEYAAWQDAFRTMADPNYHKLSTIVSEADKTLGRHPAWTRIRKQILSGMATESGARDSVQALSNQLEEGLDEEDGGAGQASPEAWGKVMADKLRNPK